MKFKKYGVVLFLIIAISGFSLSSVSADDHEYWNTLKVGKWYGRGDLNISSHDKLHDLFHNSPIKSHCLIYNDVVELGYDSNHEEILKPLKAGEYCNWHRSRACTALRWYHWTFV